MFTRRSVRISAEQPQREARTLTKRLLCVSTSELKLRKERRKRPCWPGNCVQDGETVHRVLPRSQGGPTNQSRFPAVSGRHCLRVGRIFNASVQAVLALIAYYPRWASQACHNGQAAPPRSMSRVNCSGNGSMMVSSDTRRDPAFEEDFDTGEGGRSSRCLSATCHCDVAIIDCTATFAKTASPIGIGSSRMDSCDLSQR